MPATFVKQVLSQEALSEENLPKGSHQSKDALYEEVIFPRTFWEYVQVVRATLCANKTPMFLSGSYVRQRLRILGVWSLDNGSDKASWYKCYERCLRLLAFVNIVTVAFGLPDPQSNIFQFVDELNVLISLIMMFSKMWSCSWNSNRLDGIVNELDCLHRRHALERHPVIGRLLRRYFLLEAFNFLFFQMVGVVASFALIIQTLLIGKSLPFNARYPFRLEDPAIHPYTNWMIFALQSSFIVYSLQTVVALENVCAHSTVQVALHSQIVCIRLKELGTDFTRQQQDGNNGEWMLKELRAIIQHHQYTIRLSERMNGILQSSHITQIFASNLMLCLSSFAFLLARGDTMLILKETVYIFLALCQLFYWSLIGTLVHSQSLNVATAAFRTNRWLEQSPIFKRHLLLMMLRAQKALAVQGVPFRAFYFETFATILSSSYSYFAMLRTLVE